MHNFKELRVWQEAMILAKDVFIETRKFPKEEKYSLTAQINRCSVSIASNIAEGAGRGTAKDFNHFLSIALGSAFELETQLLLSRDFNYLNPEQTKHLTEKTTKVQRMINGLKNATLPKS